VNSEQLGGPDDLVRAAHETGELQRQVVGPDVERSDWRERIPQPVDDQVVEALGMSDVL
jgi:hypothetical protein